MLIDSLLNEHTIDGAISPQQLNILFKLLDSAGVSALWVDKDFQEFEYNQSNTIISDAVKKYGTSKLSYIELMPIIYKLHKGANGNDNPMLSATNWIEKLRQQQGTRMVPSEDYVVLSVTGQRFISRRVFLTDGSMLVISFDYIELHHRDDLTKVAFTMSKSGILCYNAQTNEFLIESPYLERILTQKEYANVNKYGLLAIIHPDDSKSAKEIFRRAIETQTVVTKNVKIKTKKRGSLWFKFTGERQKGSTSNSRQFILTFKDVTEELVTQENLRQHLEDSNKKLKERLDFMAKLSHELKTPMNAIVGISDALLYRDGTPEDIRSKLELIQLSSENLLNMLDDTLSHAKLKNSAAALNLEDSNPKKLIGDICKLWENQALKNGTIIRFDAAQDLPLHIKVDASRLTQCLNNLISNATKFTEYGYIDVIVKLHNSPNKQSHLAIAIKDTGIGMTDEQQGKIFEAYKQADETISSRFGGTGLGMSITKDLIELMGGKISVKSEPNKGTLFLIALPLDTKDITHSVTKQGAMASPKLTIRDTRLGVVKSATNNEGEQATEQTRPPTQINTSISTAQTETASPSQILMSKASISATELEKLNILVVDDNETNHIVMSSLLDSVIGKIYSAFDGKQALDVLAVENIDVVLMDIHMPVMDGIEATISIRQNPDLYSDVRIIALTADPQYQQKRICVNIGMDDAIAKPVKLVDLIETIKKTLRAPINSLSKTG